MTRVLRIAGFLMILAGGLLAASWFIEPLRELWPMLLELPLPIRIGLAVAGLGLLIVRRVVREHGGEIEIESQPNHGTTIHILLPRGPKPVRLLQSSDRVIDLEPFESQPS